MVSESQTELLSFQENLRRSTQPNPEAGSARGDGDRDPLNPQDVIGRRFALVGALQRLARSAERHRESPGTGRLCLDPCASHKDRDIRLGLLHVQDGGRSNRSSQPGRGRVERVRAGTRGGDSAIHGGGVRIRCVFHEGQEGTRTK